MADLTQALSGLDADASAAAELLAQLNDRLRELAAPRLRHGRPAQTLQATDLVPEADPRLVDGRDSPRWESRAHCFAAAAEAMRRILIDPARRKGSLKHGGQFEGIANFFVRAASIAFFSERDRIEPESGRDAQARASSELRRRLRQPRIAPWRRAGGRSQDATPLRARSLMMFTRSSLFRTAVVGLSLALVVPSAVADFNVQQNVAFTAKRQSPYGPGAAFEILEPGLNILRDPFLLNAGPAIEIDAWDAVLGGLLPSDLLPNIFSLEAGFGVKGTNNLDLGYYVSGGRLDVTYPASSKLNFDTGGAGNDLVTPSQQYSIGSQFLPGVAQRSIPSEFWTTLGPGGPALSLTREVSGEGGFRFRLREPPTSLSSPSFIVHSPYASAWLDSRIDVRVGAYVKVEALGGLIDESVDFTFGGSIGDRIAEIDPSGLYVAGNRVGDVSLTDPIPITVPVAGGSATLTLPQLGLASSSQQGDKLIGFEKQPVLTMTANLERLIPGVGPILENKIGPFGYKLVSVTAGPIVSLYQEMSFDPNPEVDFQFSEPVLVRGTLSGDVVVAGPGEPQVTTRARMSVEGGNLDWQPMISDSSQITISPTYRLKNDFTTEVGVDFSVGGRVTALEISHPFGTTPPLVDEAFSFSLLQEPLFGKTFTVPIGDVIAERVRIPKSNIDFVDGDDLKFAQLAVTSNPEPGVLIADLQFKRRLADGTTRTYVAPNVRGRQTSFANGLPDPGEGNESYSTFAADAPIIVTDPVTGEQFDLGRYILNGVYDVSSLLPGESPFTIDLDQPQLGRLYTNTLGELPNTDVDVAANPLLREYNDLDFTSESFSAVGTPNVVDRRVGGSSRVIVGVGDVNPEITGSFRSLGFIAQIADDGAVFFSGTSTPFDPAAEAPGGFYRGDGKLRSVQVAERDPSPEPNRPFLLGESDFVVNGQGRLAFANAGGSGLLLRDPSGVVQLIRENAPAPGGNGELVEFRGIPAINEAGEVAIEARIRVAPDQFEKALYRADKNSAVEIVRTGDPLPGMPQPQGLILRPPSGGPVLGDSGKALFAAGGLDAANRPIVGLYLGDGGPATKVAVSGDLVPRGYQVDGFYEWTMNAGDQAAFLATVKTGAVGNPPLGAYRWDAGQLTEIAVQGETLSSRGVPLGSVGSLFGISINDLGSVAFTDEATGVYLYQNGSLQEKFHIEDPAPGGGEIHTGFLGSPLLNDADQLAFQVSTFDGSSSHIYLHDGDRLVEVASVGQALAGSTVTRLVLGDLNDRMQVAYWARLADGREVIARFDPSLYWKTPGGGDWASGQNWSLGVDPARPYDALIIAEQPLTVNGPAVDSAVRSLVLGGANSGEAVLNLLDGTTLAIDEGAIIRANGLLRGRGAIDGDVVNDGGVVSPGNSPGVLHIVGDYRQGDLGTLLLEIAGADAGTQYDVLDVTGDVLLAGTVNLSFLDGYVPTPGTRFNLIAFDGALDASHAQFVVTGAPPGSQFTAFAQNGVFGIVAGVPEPSTCGLAIAALAASFSRRRRRPPLAV